MSTINVLRYSAIVTGIVYGAYHSGTLKKIAAKQEERKAFAKKEALIAEAKAKYAELHKKPEAKTEVGTINWDDKNLDIAKVILSYVESLPQK